MIIVLARMGENFIAKTATISAQLFFRERLRSTDVLAGNAAPWAALAQSILHGLNLHVVPVRPKRAENTAVMGHVAIPVGGAFPDAHRGKARRLKRRHMPLVDCIGRNAVEPHFAVAPRLGARPFDTVVKILGFAQ